jgi:hypothetical protein
VTGKLCPDVFHLEHFVVEWHVSESPASALTDRGTRKLVGSSL